MVSQHGEHSRSRKPSKRRHKCEHCHKLGHKIDRCYALHGSHPQSAAMVQTNPPSEPSNVDPTSSDTAGQFAILTEVLKWYEDYQNPSSTTVVTHSSTSFVGLNHSTSHGPWVLNPCAINHITGNKSLFSSLSSIGYLPFVTVVDGSKVLSHSVSIVNLFPSLPIDNALYVPKSSFNLLSIIHLTRSPDCVISLTKDLFPL